MNAKAIVFGIIAMLGAILATGCSRGQTNKQPATEASDAQSYVRPRRGDFCTTGG